MKEGRAREGEREQRERQGRNAKKGSGKGEEEREGGREEAGIEGEEGRMVEACSKVARGGEGEGQTM